MLKNFRTFIDIIKESFFSSRRKKRDNITAAKVNGTIEMMKRKRDRVRYWRKLTNKMKTEKIFYLLANRIFAKRPLQWSKSFTFFFVFFFAISFVFVERCGIQQKFYNLMQCEFAILTAVSTIEFTQSFVDCPHHGKHELISTK